MVVEFVLIMYHRFISTTDALEVARVAVRAVRDAARDSLDADERASDAAWFVHLALAENDLEFAVEAIHLATLCAGVSLIAAQRAVAGQAFALASRLTAVCEGETLNQRAVAALEVLCQRVREGRDTVNSVVGGQGRISDAIASMQQVEAASQAARRAIVERDLAVRDAEALETEGNQLARSMARSVFRALNAAQHARIAAREAAIAIDMFLEEFVEEEE